MRPTFSPNMDTVEVPNAMPMVRARTAPPDEGLCRSDSTSAFHPYQYPPTISVRNTFLVFPGRDPSLEEFFEERRAHSSPAKCREDSREEEEVPLASSRTTACGSASTGSGTPPQTPPLELSDAEDMSELTDRELRFGLNASAAAPPASGRSEDSQDRPALASSPRRSEDSQPANGLEAPGADTMQRQALPPGPIQGTAQPQMTANGVHIGYYLESYHDGYENGYSNGIYDNGFANGYVCDYDEGFNAGYQTAISGYILVPAGPGQEDIGQQMVLQMSSPGHPGIHLPPPPGPPAPSPSPLPPTPAPPSQEPLPQVAPTRGSMGHGFARCKPCAFVHTKGCGNGFECPFCHLCEPGEKKKRRKDKQESRRSFRNSGHAFPFGTSFQISNPMPIDHGLFS